MVLHHYPNLINSRFATSQRNFNAIYSTYTQRILSACGAPAAVWATFAQDSTSTFNSFTDSRDGNTVFRKYFTSFHFCEVLTFVQDGYMALRIQWRSFKGGLDLLSEPYLSYLKDRMSRDQTLDLYPRLYYSYNAGTRQTTIMTTDLNQLYLRMVQHLETLPKMTNQLECPEQIIQLLSQCFVVVRENFGRTAAYWDTRAIGEVSCGEPRFNLSLMSLNRTWHQKL